MSLFRKVVSAKSSTVIHDAEFGEVKVRRVRTKYVRLRVQPNGELVASMPFYATLGSVRMLIDSSRENLRKSIARAPQKRQYHDGEQIGKSHKLRIRENAVRAGVNIKGQEIIINLRENTPKFDREKMIRDGVGKALRKEAKAYLPRRLRYLAMQNGLRYETVRFSHAKSRWGSCSSRGTISLNIALMTLPNELIDYVLLHELTHTQHMNHSPEFWARLGEMCPDAKLRKKQIANYSPFL